MELEDLEPRRKKPQPKDLDAMGVDELKAYLEELRSEVERVTAKIEAKQAYLSGADTLFKR